MKAKHYLFILLFLLIGQNAGAIDFTIDAITPMKYQVPGTKSFRISIKNIPQDATGWPFNANIYWQLNNGAVNMVSKTFGDIDWVGWQEGWIDDPSFKAILPTPGKYTLKAWMEIIVPVDTNAANDTFVMEINVINTLPKKNVLMEVWKHQTCPPCYDANIYNDTAAVSKNPGYFIVGMFTVYKSEALYNADANVVNLQYGLGHPSVTYDRFKLPYWPRFVAHYVYNQTGGRIIELYGEREQFYEPVQVSFANTNFNESTRELEVLLEASFFDDLNGDYRFNLYLVEDSIKGYQSDAPDPDNFIHNHVLRAMLGGPWGAPGSIPTSVKQGDKKHYKFSYTIPADYKLNHLSLVGMVQTYNSDSMNRRILNSEHKKLNQLVSVNNMSTGTPDIRVYPNPVKNTLKISLGAYQQDYQLKLMDISGKVYHTQHCKGDTEIDLQSLPQGNYFLYIDDGKVVYTRNVSKE